MGARLSSNQEGTRGDLKVVGCGRNGWGRIQSPEIRLMYYDISLCAQVTRAETPHLHRTHLETFSDVGSGKEIGKWRGEPLSEEPRFVYTCCPCISLALVSETVRDSNLSRLWAEIYSLSRRGAEVCPRVRSMAHSHPHSHIHTGILWACWGSFWSYGKNDIISHQLQRDRRRRETLS